MGLGTASSLQEVFPLARVEKKKENKATAVWKERYALSLHPSLPPSLPPPSSALDIDTEAPPAKKSRVEEETDFSMASLVRGEVTEVSRWSIT